MQDICMSEAGTLAGLEPGRTAIVGDLAFGEADRVRVMEMGFIPGAPVSCQRVVPMGDLAVYQVDGGLIAIRRETAEQIGILSSADERAESAERG